MGPRLRLFSYLPNPRLAKATIAARLCGVELEIRGAKPRELAGWLWDFDARPLEEGEGDASTAREARTGFAGRLHKTDAFLAANPFGTVPVAFSPDGSVGIFESNSMLRAVARLGRAKRNLYGDDPYTASRIDSFLDASLVFARDAQRYLLGMGSSELPAIHAQAKESLEGWLGGIEQALQPDRAHLVGKDLSLADIVFATELVLFSVERGSRERLAELGLSPCFDDTTRERFPAASAHYDSLCRHEAFAPDLAPYLAKLAGSSADD